MVKTIISVDPKKAPWEQDTPLHNRWHPDIPAVAKVEQGEKFREYSYLVLFSRGNEVQSSHHYSRGSTDMYLSLLY